MQHFGKNAFLTVEILDLIHEDVTCACDDADLRRRLARNGYGFRDTAKGRMLVTLPHQVEVCPLP
jgi:GT2 family glycosyltransferase